MAKLYAELTSDKGVRVASKGGEGFIKVALTKNNTEVYKIWFDGESLTVRKDGKKWVYDDEQLT